MTVAIAFTGGTYGTYMDWCLSTLTSAQEIMSPFTASGSSHNHQGKQVLNIEGWNAYIRSGQPAAFVRLHPKVTKNQSLSRNLDQLCQQANRVIHMYPSKDTMLLCMNNAFSKTTDNWWKKSFSREIDPEKIYQNWSIAPGTDIDDIPRWVKREFLSFYMMPMWYDQIEWHHPTTWSNPNCIVVNVDELLYNFEFTINKVKEFCNLEFKKNIADLLPYHKENLQKQKYLSDDLICSQIVESIVGDQFYSWEPLSLCSESWIQWHLRKLGFEIRCDGLDNFPTNSLHLKELLYPV